MILPVSDSDVEALRGRRSFLRRAGLSSLILGLGDGLPMWAFAAPRTSAESLGISSAAVRTFLQAVAASPHELHSLMIARHGQVAAQGWCAPYRADTAQRLYSLSKSFTSTAVGFAITAGKLKLSDRVVDFFPDQTPPKISENLAAMRVENLLTMSTGHESDTTPLVTREQDWVKAFLSLPVQHEPGSVFVYNSAASYILSAIVQKAVGEKIVDYLRPRFFDPLGLPKMRWAICPRGINTGGWGLYATTQTLRQFGQFYLQAGKWNGQQLLPKSWVDAATSFKIQQPAAAGQNLEQLKQVSDWHQGYGYQFWRCRHGALRGDGAFGQFCIVLPHEDAVIAITSCTLDMQGLLNLVWDHLLAGFYDSPLAEDRSAADSLQSELAGLTLKLPQGTAMSSMITPSSAYDIEPNSLGVVRVSLRLGTGSCSMVFHTAQKDYAINCGMGHWLDGETDLPGTPPEFTELVGIDASPRRPMKLAAAGAWTDDNTLQMQWRYYETPHFDTVTCKFVDNRFEIKFLNSITQLASVHAESRPVLNGKKRS